MGKAAHHKKKLDEKRSIKDKKKFKNRNSIGKAKKKTGSAGRYMTRTQAVNKLQVPLKDFRKLCILKGVYPREPKKKFKGSNTTYYFAKDILFLAHEPILDKFREQKAFLKKIRKALGRHEKRQAKRLDGRRPVYKLDHLIRERYPTFVDALQELDDVLCLVCLFGTIAPSKYVPAARIANCARLRREFLAHVARTGALRKTFISIKGIYYQAEVHGVSLTWVEPHHSFAQKPTMVVDYRVMLSFLELYEAVLTFVNFKLYHDGGLLYPPPIDDKADHSGAHLSAALAVPHSGPPTAKAVAEVAAGASKGRALPAPGRGTAPAPPSAAVLAGLHAKLAKVDRPPSGAEAAAEPTAGGEADAAEAEGGAEGGDGGAADGAFALSAGSIEEAAQSADTAAVRGLFTGCHFFCARETPVPALEFVLLSCGGRVGWEGEASPFARDDPRITHQVIDRPPSGDAAGGAGSADAAARRELVQPQWVFDCVNARAVLPTHAYRPGVQCPPHLSPFLDGGEGYEPKERYSRELASEFAGKSYAPQDGGSKKRRSMPADGAAGEEKALAMLMMSRKKRRLYDRMQYGIEKKKVAADVLRAKRDALDAAANAKGTKSKGKAGKAA